VVTGAVAPAASPSGGMPNVEPPLVTVTDLWKQFPVPRSIGDLLRQPVGVKPSPAVADVSLEVHAGEFVGLLGPNGAGKTTLLKILATLIVPDRGTATVAGHDVVEAASSVRSVIASVLANERSLYWRLSAKENLELFAALLRLRPQDAASRVSDALEVVGLADVGKKMVGQFSAGMMQRLLVARALLGHPRVLLLDEPAAGLSQAEAQLMTALLRRLDPAITLLIIEHDMDIALEVARHVTVLHYGRVIADGTREAVRADPTVREIYLGA
jgi:ABC-2 type transport system ATP-binding protein